MRHLKWWQIPTTCLPVMSKHSFQKNSLICIFRVLHALFWFFYKILLKFSNIITVFMKIIMWYDLVWTGNLREFQFDRICNCLEDVPLDMAFGYSCSPEFTVVKTVPSALGPELKKVKKRSWALASMHTFIWSICR